MGLSRWRGGKESACQCRRCKRCRFNPEWGRSPRGGRGKSLQNSCLEKKSPGHRNLVGYSPLGRKESDTTSHTYTRAQYIYVDEIIKNENMFNKVKNNMKHKICLENCSYCSLSQLII